MNTMEKIVIRPANPGDAPTIAALHVKSWRHAYRGQLPADLLEALSVETRTKIWSGILSADNEKMATLIAEIGGEIVGHCSVGPCWDGDVEKDTGELYSLYIDPDCMGKGAGSALLEQGLAFLLESGYGKATLWILISHVSSRRFYERRNWTPTKTTKSDLRNGFEFYEMRYLKTLA